MAIPTSLHLFVITVPAIYLDSGLQQRKESLNLLLVVGKCDRVIRRTCKLSAERFQVKPKPTKTVKRLLENCRNYGSFRPKTERRNKVV